MGYIHNFANLFSGLVAGCDFRGDAKDFSGNQNDGTVTGATPTTDRFGIANSAYLVDANRERIYYDLGAGNFNDDKITCIFGFKQVSNTQSGHLMNLATSTSPTGTTKVIQIYGQSDTGYNVQMYKPSSNTVNGSPFTFSTGSVKNIAFTYNKSTTTAKLYVDGSTILNDTSITNDLDAGRYLYLGGIPNYDQSINSGIYDYFLIFNRDLSADEIQAITDLLSKGYIYLYPQHRKQIGVSE